MILSVMNVIGSPIPFLPKTSVGYLFYLAIVSAVATAVVSRLRVREVIQSVRVTATDVFILLYTIITGVSLLLSQEVYDTTSFRLLIAGVCMYGVVRLVKVTDIQKRALIHALGIVSIFIAVFSVLQVLLPDVANPIAKAYFFSDEGYSISDEFNRGRLLFVGQLMLSFPFLWGSIVLLRKSRNPFFRYTYPIVGAGIMFLAYIMSNFRWTMAVFGLTSVGMFVMMVKDKFISRRAAWPIVGLFVATAAVGLIGARVVMGYNMLDRLLLTETERDVTNTIGRLYLYGQAIRLFVSSPVYGSGYGLYGYNVEVLDRYYLKKTVDQVVFYKHPTASHDEFLTILAETGVVGLVAYLGILLTTFSKLHLLVFYPKTKETDPGRLVFLVSAFVGLISFYAYILLENPNPNNIVAVFMLAGLVQSWATPDEAKPSGRSV
jgi:O-antigen ligase